jgi:hypothetical protein
MPCRARAIMLLLLDPLFRPGRRSRRRHRRFRRRSQRLRPVDRLLQSSGAGRLNFEGVADSAAVGSFYSSLGITFSAGKGSVCRNQRGRDRSLLQRAKPQHRRHQLVLLAKASRSWPSPTRQTRAGTSAYPTEEVRKLNLNTCRWYVCHPRESYPPCFALWYSRTITPRRVAFGDPVHRLWRPVHRQH